MASLPCGFGILVKWAESIGLDLLQQERFRYLVLGNWENACLPKVQVWDSLQSSFSPSGMTHCAQQMQLPEFRKEMKKNEMRRREAWGCLPPKASPKRARPCQAEAGLRSVKSSRRQTCRLHFLADSVAQSSAWLCRKNSCHGVYEGALVSRMICGSCKPY